MAKTTALSFIMAVRDLEKSVKFYCDAFGLEEVFRAETIVFVGSINIVALASATIRPTRSMSLAC